MSSYPPDPEFPQEYPPGDAYSQPPQDPYAPRPDAISGRVTPPAVALLVVSIINLLLGLGMIGFGFASSKVPLEQLEAQMQRQNPQQLAEMRQQGMSLEMLINIYVYGGLGGGAVALFVCLLTMIGAIRMMMLKSYGLAVFASVLMAIPCISPCCGVGTGVGVWALIVLLNPDVRAAFR
jgi:hypothetical protein